MKKKSQGTAVQGTEAQGCRFIIRPGHRAIIRPDHRAIIRPDKCLLSEDIRKMFLTCQEIGGHKHEFKAIIYFPEEIFLEKVLDKAVFFVPAVHEKNGNDLFLEKFPVPIFMIEFTAEQKTELETCAKRNKLFLVEYYFRKPRVLLKYDREELEEDSRA